MEIEKLQNIRMFLLDMDGTFYLGDHLLPGALEFLDKVRASGRRFCFLTNNSSKSRGAYLDKLAALGARVSEQEMFTSGDATLEYLEMAGISKDILLIGTPSLEAQFAAAGYRLDSPAPQAVVLGFDTTITYQKLTALCDAVRAGLPYIATHPDFNCPVPGGFIPDIGAVIAFVRAATGRDPDLVVGKPNAMIAQAAARRAGGGPTVYRHCPGAELPGKNRPGAVRRNHPRPGSPERYPLHRNGPKPGGTAGVSGLNFPFPAPPKKRAKKNRKLA